MTGIFYICNDDEKKQDHFFYADRPRCETGPIFFEIQFKADFGPVNGKDDTLYQNYFRVHFRRIFKQGRERLATMARIGVFRNY